MGRKSETSALSALSALERGEVLSSLLRAHPSLVAEAERVAAGLLGTLLPNSVPDQAARA
jgi:hypothetical protein